MDVIGELVHEREEEGDEIAVPDVHVDILVLFGLEERNGVYLDLAKRGAVECVQSAVQDVIEIFLIDFGNELRDLLLCNRWREINIPRGQAGEGFIVAGEQAV